MLYGLIALAAFGMGILVNSSRQSEVQKVTAADALLAIRLPDLENKPQRLSQWQGKVIVVNFWASWCAPCREEIPMFVKMQEQHGAKGLQFVGISIDQADKTSEFAATYRINYPTLIGTFEAIEISHKAGNLRRTLPFTVILNRKGQIVATATGGVTQTKLEGLLNPLL